ncbi:dynein regulatory complex subunit 7-like isoform X1 [Mercenaria mercenaria]|uniref:dynein regulatory complex subunit 7-like isoform X1 n=1 Tax=Mercenaria mercenaria TaxID=6596 RepID=UPI00234EAC38|nr:dynein regulatory complex subunit 7-like isoform X1 [Mercenaria mercenaria]
MADTEPQLEQENTEDTLKEEDEEGSVHSGEELTEDAQALKDELAKIVVHPPTVEQIPKETFDPAEFPASYKENLPNENLVLQFAENFRRQYVHLYRDRKPLLLNPVNECFIEKFVCTTIRPTQLEYKELYNWDGAAEFVADYLNFETLDPPYELPKRLLSPTTILKRQKGNCFEYSTLLCSLLIGAGYDAYVVSGYATREVCLADESREICPLLKRKEEIKAEEKKKELKKYTVKPPKDLQSKFERKQAAKAQAEKEAEEAKRRAEEEERLAELEKPPPDPLYGLRIHSWVLILSGKREVPESFFVEPFTGLSHPVESTNYLGIESVWNHVNYWVNMQDCSEGVKNLSYDLGDCTRWEYMFPNTDKPLLQIPEAEDDIMDGLDDEEDDKHYMRDNTMYSDDHEAQEDLEKQLDLPPTWVEPIRISKKDFEMRCPQGKKNKLYKRAKLEKFAHYLMKDGLVSRLSVYSDRELTDLVMTREYFAHREDKLYNRVHNHQTTWITEYFQPGRAKCVKEHQYKAGSPGPENERTMLFYDEARVDGLVKRIETPAEMTEHFHNRDDFLYYKHIDFGKKPKKFGPQDGSSSQTHRPILKMILKFHRNKNKLANEDILECVFLCSEDKIQITYHTEDKRIASSTREFLKPHNWDEKGATLTFSPDMHQTFQVGSSLPTNKQVELYEMLLYLLEQETKSIEAVRDSEEEVREILNDRTQEEATQELDISVYDTERNEKAKKHRRELERQQLEEKMRKQEMEIDYLAPFLAQIGDPDKITRQQAYKLKEDCLADLKQRLIDKANLIQARFEKETQKLQKKQAWYQQNQVSMLKDDEESYLEYCSQAMFRIHILELRLNRHKDQAPHKYMMLEQTLRQDPRLAEYF